MGGSSDDGPLKIREPYDPIGGGGTTALRITYTHKSGEEHKLTFLRSSHRSRPAHRLSTHTVKLIGGNYQFVGPGYGPVSDESRKRRLSRTAENLCRISDRYSLAKSSDSSVITES